MPIADLGLIPHDTSKSCVFDYPDRPVRPVPPVYPPVVGQPPPPYPYEPWTFWGGPPEPEQPPNFEEDDDGSLNTGSLHQWFFECMGNTYAIVLPQGGGSTTYPVKIIMYRQIGVDNSFTPPQYQGQRVKTWTIDAVKDVALNQWYMTVDGVQSIIGNPALSGSYRSETDTGYEYFWFVWQQLPVQPGYEGGGNTNILYPRVSGIIETPAGTTVSPTNENIAVKPPAGYSFPYWYGPLFCRRIRVDNTVDSTMPVAAWPVGEGIELER